MQLNAPRATPGRFRNLAKVLFGCFLTGIGVLFSLAFYDRYWRWRDCFNELGRCYDPASQDVYLEQAGLVWGSLAAISLSAGVILLCRCGFRRRIDG